MLNGVTSSLKDPNEIIKGQESHTVLSNLPSNQTDTGNPWRTLNSRNLEYTLLIK
ncbi:hypothetical protein J2747_001772 [Thermococcus stetteri]|nr:hypothetical protein [Thermococcus stetteri]